MNTLKIGQHCPVHKGIYAGIDRSFSSEPDNHIWLLDAKSPEEYMNWADATAWAESLGEATGLPTRHEAVLLGCHLLEELGGNGYVWTSTSYGALKAWRQQWDVTGPGYSGSVGVVCTYRVRAVKRLPVTNTASASVADNNCTILPDGSAFAVDSFPLPKDHWLYAPREYDVDAVNPKELPSPILTHALRAEVVSAIRYAIRGATMCGKETDFDPDALVQNAVYALCGPYRSAALVTPTQAGWCKDCNPDNCSGCATSTAPVDAAVQQESPYDRGFRHGYNRRDAEVKGALL